MYYINVYLLYLNINMLHYSRTSRILELRDSSSITSTYCDKWFALPKYL